MAEKRNNNIYKNEVQSANSIFHFMKEMVFLKDAILNKRLSPRYCKENVDYLKLKIERKNIKQIAILGKSFCDIPLHRINAKNKIDLIRPKRLKESVRKNNLEQSSHPDLYGKYAIAFSKKWGIEKGIQPVSYVHENANSVSHLSEAIRFVYRMDNVDNKIVDVMLDDLSFNKPIYGSMEREIDFRKITIGKVFRDEQEWRYIPDCKTCKEKEISSIIVQEEMFSELNSFSDSISSQYYEDLWLKFGYDDIKYIIVPLKADRDNLIDWIENNIELEGPKETRKTKSVLISKIMTLSEIGEDW